MFIFCPLCVRSIGLEPCDCDCVGCYCGRSGHDRLYFLQVCRSTWNMRITELLSVWQILIKCLDSLQKVMNLHK